MVIQFDKKKIQRLQKQGIKSDIPMPMVHVELDVVLDLLETTKVEKIKEHLKRYLIIRIVSIMEYYFKETVVDLIDEFDCPYHELFDEPKVSLPLSNLDDIHEEKITKGQIISASLILQNKSKINDVVSKLIFPDFLKTIKSYKITDSVNPFANNWDKFLEILNVRHDIVHNPAIKVNYSDKEIRQIINASDIFFTLSTFLIYYNVYKKTPKKLKSKYKIVYNWYYPDKKHIVI